MTFDAKLVLIGAFMKWRQAGFSPGISELLDCMSAVDRGWGASEAELKRTMQLLWCNSTLEAAEFNEAWSALVLPGSLPKAETDLSHQGQANVEVAESSEPPPPQWTSASAPVPEPRKETLSPIPIRTNASALERSSRQLDSYWPVSRRFMTYIWRYLRRPVNDGPLDVLNVSATVESAARRGFYYSAVYGRRTRNYSHLIILLDCGGSMVPFRRFTQGLVETAQEESEIGRVDVFYFHNVIGDFLYADSFLTNPLSLAEALDECGNDTSILLISDGGAARGQRRTTRIRLTADFLFQLRARTQLIAWLNPLPEERWVRTSAQVISHIVPMFQMDEDGLSNAIDVLRGQPLSR